MTTNERLRVARKKLGLTLESMGAELGISASAVSYIETGKGGLSERNIKILQETFGISPEWLKTGEGEMFAMQDLDEQITRFLKDILVDSSDFKMRLISVLARMTPDEWDLLERKILELSGQKNSRPD